MNADASETVVGERGPSALQEALSPHARVSNLLAMGIMLAMGAGLLTLYYFHAAQRQMQAQQKVRADSSGRAQAEMALPSLGTITAPAAAGIAPIELTVAPSVPLDLPAGSSSGAAPTTTRPPSSLERRLSGASFTVSNTTTTVTAPAVNGAADAGNGGQGVGTGGSGGDARAPLSALLIGDPTGSVAARVLPTQQLLLPKGSFIDCTLETAIDSSLPGLTSCVTATDTFGVDGRVVLLERGTKLVGETRGQLQQGMARVFVLWTEARTPSGVVVALDSPAADALGRSGLTGSVERHFWERFGAALLVSSIDGAVQAAVQSSNRGNGTIIYNPSAAQDVGTEVLKSTLTIAPTVRIGNGVRVQVLVARDLDFTPVYELRHAGSQR